MRMLLSDMVPFLLLRYNVDALFVILLTPALQVRSDWQYEMNFLIGLFVSFSCFLLKAFLHGCDASPHLSCKRDQIKKERFYGQAGRYCHR